MREAFLNVLEASFHGGVIIALVLILRLALKNAPRRFICLLWLLAGLRLLLPFQIESGLSLQPDPSMMARPQAQIQTPQQDMVPALPEDAGLPEDVVIVIGDGVENPGEAPARRVTDWGAVGAWVWLAGVCAMAIYSAGAYIALRRRIREAVKTADGVYRCHGLDTAFVLGCFRPRIYIPAEVSDIDSVLAHERAHIRRGDHWFKLLGFAALAVHWFNPLVWAAYLLLCRDLEMACDEAVVRDMDLKQRKAYSAALLACAASRSGIAACPVAFGEVSVKRRILRVLGYRRPRFWICVMAAAAVLFVAVCFVTSPGGLTKAETLEAFYREMDAIQSSERLHLSFTVDLFESEMAEVVQLEKQDYWQDGNVWYRTFEYRTAAGGFTTCYAEIDGVQYACEYSEDIPGFNNRDWQELAVRNYANLPMLTTDWRSLAVLEVRRDRTDGGAYTVKLQGDMTDAGPTDTYYEKYWEIHLDRDGRLLCMHLYTHGEFYMYYADTSGIYETKSITTIVVGEWDDGWRQELAALGG